MAEPMQRRTRILCIDDEPGLADLVASMLEERGDRIDATGISDPTDVVSRLESDAFDCVISDYEMPILDGLELLAAVREAFPAKPFILYTGRGSEAIASEAISKGVTDYLQKGSGTEQYDLLANRCLNAVERVRNRKQREQAEQWYRQLFDQRLVGVGLSQDGTYRQANEYFAEFVGYDPDELVGMDVLSTIRPADRPRVERALRERERGSADKVRYTVDLQRKDGSTTPVNVVGSQVTYRGSPAVLGLIQPAGDRRQSVPGPLLERLSTAADALAEMDDREDGRVTEARENLRRARSLLADPVSNDPDGDVETSLDAAIERAADLANVGDDRLRIAGNDTVEACEEVVVRLVEQILVATLGADPDGATVRVEPTGTGFRVEVRGPDLDHRLDMPVVNNVQSPPDPVAEFDWYRGVDVYCTLVDEETVEYEAVIPSMVSDHA